jgi:hypothetical protein
MLTPRVFGWCVGVLPTRCCSGCVVAADALPCGSAASQPCVPFLAGTQLCPVGHTTCPAFATPAGTPGNGSRAVTGADLYSVVATIVGSTGTAVAPSLTLLTQPCGPDMQARADAACLPLTFSLAATNLAASSFDVNVTLPERLAVVLPPGATVVLALQAPLRNPSERRLRRSSGPGAASSHHTQRRLAAGGVRAWGVRAWGCVHGGWGVGGAGWGVGGGVGWGGGWGGVEW